MWKKVCKYHIIHDTVKVCIFQKKTVTCTRSLPKKYGLPWYVPQKFACFSQTNFKILPLNSLAFNRATSASAPLATENWPSECFKSKRKFSVANIGMVHHSTLALFAWVTMFIVAYWKIYHLAFTFQKQNIVESQQHKYAWTVDVAHKMGVTYFEKQALLEIISFYGASKWKKQNKTKMKNSGHNILDFLKGFRFQEIK